VREPEDYKVSAALARKKSQDYQEYKNKMVKSSKSTPVSKKYTAYVKNRLNEIVPMEFDFDMNEDSKDDFTVDLMDNSDDEIEGGLTEEEWNLKQEKTDQHKQEVNKAIQEWHDSEVDLALNALCAIEPTYAPRRNKEGIKIYQAKPVNTKDQACFQFAFGNCTAGKECIYSHESEKIKKFLKSSYERLALSPAWDPKFITDVNTNRNSGGSGYDRRNVADKSNHGGRGHSQSPAKNINFNNGHAKNYVITEKNNSENTEELPGTGADQPPSAEKQSGLSRVAPMSASRDNADC
jgi:hypothetical protein